jgi:UDP-3-O-[3-hydroxymyristoyl] glucosamine N-acyltransferase
LIFYNDYKYSLQLKNTKAKACLITKEDSNLLPTSCSAIIVDDPYLSFACLSNLFKDDEKSPKTFKSNKFETRVSKNKSKYECRRF